jgi:hypothetical protein
MAQSNSSCLNTDTSQPITWTLPSTPGTPNWAINSHGYTLSDDLIPQPEQVPFSATFWRRPECPTQLILTLNLSGSVELLGYWSAFQAGTSTQFLDMIVDDPADFGANRLVFAAAPTIPPTTISGVVDFIDSSFDPSQAMTIDYTPLSASGAESVVSLQIPAAGPPPPFGIGPGITGSWYDPAESGHGFSLEVLPNNQLLAYWYVYAPPPLGGQAWIVANGAYSGNTAANLTAYWDVGSGALFPPDFDPNALQAQQWGTITFTFTDCNNGTVSWQPVIPGYTAGSIPITRLTAPAGFTCP